MSFHIIILTNKKMFCLFELYKGMHQLGWLLDFESMTFRFSPSTATLLTSVRREPILFKASPLNRRMPIQSFLLHFIFSSPSVI